MANGGKRPGAGRKPSTLKGVLKKLPCETAELILAEINAQQKLVDLANSEDESIALATIKFLWEQAHGKAKQAVEHSGKDGEQFRVIVEHIGLQKPQNTASTKAN